MWSEPAGPPRARCPRQQRRFRPCATSQGSRGHQAARVGHARQFCLGVAAHQPVHPLRPHTSWPTNGLKGEAVRVLRRLDGASVPRDSAQNPVPRAPLRLSKSERLQVGIGIEVGVEVVKRSLKRQARLHPHEHDVVAHRVNVCGLLLLGYSIEPAPTTDSLMVWTTGPTLAGQATFRTDHRFRRGRRYNLRARGDARGNDGLPVTANRLASRTRVWSGRRPGPGDVRIVAPAPVGMLRPLRRSRPRSAGRPRARGDAPLPTGTKIRSARSAPRRRGCSRLGAAVLLGHLVGPAPEGMLRGRELRTRDPMRCPRALGDAPVDLIGTSDDWGSPAPALAGMVRCGTPRARPAEWPPRPRCRRPVASTRWGSRREHPAGQPHCD